MYIYKNLKDDFRRDKRNTPARRESGCFKITIDLFETTSKWPGYDFVILLIYIYIYYVTHYFELCYYVNLSYLFYILGQRHV
jgi:hypothetical protein